MLPEDGHAATYDGTTQAPILWTEFVPQSYKIGGLDVRDSENAAGSDLTNGGASFNADSDLSSGYPQTTGTCNPVVGGAHTLCGTKATAFFDYNKRGTISEADDYLFFRMRLSATPAAGGDKIANGHWNTLLDIDGDGFKEFWVDIEGNGSGGIVNLYYQDRANQSLEDAGTPALLDSWRVARFTACNATTGAGTCRYSHTRVVAAGDGTSEFFMDVQMPVSVFDNLSGAQMISTATNVRLIFSTSNSSTDPLQKDFSATCIPPLFLGTCGFGDTTPVSLTHVASKRAGGATVVNFATAIEAAHSGFFIETKQGGEWKTARFVPGSEGPTPLQRRDYSVTLKGNFGGEYRLVELDSQGGKRVHGPYRVGRNYGDAHPAAYRSIDWKSAAAEWRSSEAALNKSRSVALATMSKAATPGVSRPLAEIEVSEPGVVRVRAAELRALGVSIDSIDTGDYALIRGHDAVPLYTSRSGGTLADSDYIEFVADFVPTLYTRSAVYQLRADKARSSRVTIRNANVPNSGRAPAFHIATRSFETNRTYSFSAPTADPFYDARILAYGRPASYAKQISLDRLYAQGGDVQVKTTLWGGADFPASPDHHAVISINGVQVADERFDGTDAAVVQASLPAASLAAGALSLKIDLPFDNGQIFDLVNYDRLDVTYPRQLVMDQGKLDFELDADIVSVGDAGSADVSAYAFDGNKLTRLRTSVVCTTAAAAPCTVRFAGLPGLKRYVIGNATAAQSRRALRAAPADANLFAGDADLLIVSHAQFRSVAERLADARRGEGLTVDVVDVADVYRQFGNGSPDPAAIRSYLAEAKQRRLTQYVVLFGGDTYDYHNNLGYATISHIPSSYVAYDKISRFVPSDADVVDFDRDLVPDLAIGRLPARTSAEANAMVDKILAHDRMPGFNRVTMVADRGAFAQKSAVMAALIPADISVESLNLDTSTVVNLRNAMLADLAEGIDVINYVGHSSPTQWSFENILTTGQVASINAPRPFIASQLGCWNAYYVDPSYDNVSRAMLASPTAAAAAVGPTGLADDVAEEVFAQHFFPRLHGGSARIGDAVLDAKQAMRAQGDRPIDIQLGVNLLGDPSMRLH